MARSFSFRTVCFGLLALSPGVAVLAIAFRAGRGAVTAVPTHGEGDGALGAGPASPSKNPPVFLSELTALLPQEDTKDTRAASEVATGGPPETPAAQAERASMFMRLVEEALTAAPGLSEAERRDLRAVARKRQAAFRHAPLSQAPGSVGGLDRDRWSNYERKLLGPERYATYRSALNQAMQSTGSGAK